MTGRIGDKSGVEFLQHPYPSGGVPRLGAVDVPQPSVYIKSEIKQEYAETTERRVHNHYFKDVSHLKYIDVYRVLDLFKVTDQAIGHALKKLLVAGGRGAGKDINKDIQEAIDSLNRWKEMQAENVPK